MSSDKHLHFHIHIFFYVTHKSSCSIEHCVILIQAAATFVSNFHSCKLDGSTRQFVHKIPPRSHILIDSKLHPPRLFFKVRGGNVVIFSFSFYLLISPSFYSNAGPNTSHDISIVVKVKRKTGYVFITLGLNWEKYNKNKTNNIWKLPYDVVSGG